jgi:hypothetical protein
MKRTKMRLTALGLFITILLAACNMPITPTPPPPPTSTPQPVEPEPAVSDAACIVGTWQVNNLASYLQAALPSLIKDATVEVGEVTGSLSYTFNENGSSSGTANDFKIKVKASMNGLALPGEITVNGTSTGTYQIDDSQGTLTLMNVNPGDLVASANVAGVSVVDKMPVAELFMFGSGEAGSADYTCSGNNLKISTNIENLGPRVIDFQRTQ